MISPTGRKALTFVELLFVVAIIGIVAGISLPRFRKTFDNLRLNAVSQELQSFINYLSQRAIVEGEVIYLNIDDGNKEYWAWLKDRKDRLKTYQIPAQIRIEVEQEQILFYPDGTIDKVTIKLINPDNRYVSLTTKGVYGGIKLQSQE